MRNTLVSRNITICGKRTSVRLEIEIWEAIQSICDREGLNLHELFSSIEFSRLKETSRTSAIRAFTVLYLKLVVDSGTKKPVQIPGIIPIHPLAKVEAYS